ncbi:ribonuclease 3-like protein 3 [Cornus florida]|uniref:ribonuclease 3-like protein 3 n=1 Tax=Cornus florida TaxID=4283 RepID=UPI00289F1B65|nr:ribonuclease 3-like protein 3 [Cornus florida]
MEDKEEQVLTSLQDLYIQEEEDEQEAKEPTPIIETESIPNLAGVEEIIGYSFNDKTLLQQAFTHHSYDHQESCSSYERLEFVGDAMLNLLIAREHYFFYPDLPPGMLTRLRSANVNTEKLARTAVNHQLHFYLRHRKPLLDGQIREFTNAISDYPLHSSGLIKAPKVLADIVESVIGAVFVDSNSSLDTTWKVAKSLLEPLITPDELQLHPVTKLYELCQKNRSELQFVDLWKETGAIEVFVDNKFVEKGVYRPKRLIAINRAANNAYNEIVKN